MVSFQVFNCLVLKTGLIKRIISKSHTKSAESIVERPFHKGTHIGAVNSAAQIRTYDDWEDRDVTSIPECRTCSLQLACGGGCASVAKNRSGKILAPDCRPVRELMELGFSLYGDQ